MAVFNYKQSFPVLNNRSGLLCNSLIPSEGMYLTLQRELRDKFLVNSSIVINLSTISFDPSNIFAISKWASDTPDK